MLCRYLLALCTPIKQRWHEYQVSMTAKVPENISMDRAFRQFFPTEGFILVLFTKMGHSIPLLDCLSRLAIASHDFTTEDMYI